ncbi:MAG: hypothetical protein KatS3mg104_2871 [Phycisphaerae bacterium]|nr:MAG: hypothetical protein KatS3mg104_2871 [Phycisphaerae bacterium]
MFAVAIQLPAILAVVIYFRRQLLEFVASWFRGKISPEKFYAHPLALVGIATVVTGVPAALLSDSIKENLASLVIMGWALLVGGDRYVGSRRDLRKKGTDRQRRSYCSLASSLDRCGSDSQCCVSGCQS